MYSAKVIEDSVNKFGIRAITIAICYPRFILAETNTHRMFSRSTSSSRAIPIMKMIEQVWNRPVIPVYWGKNKSGMQAAEELTGMGKWLATQTWVLASKFACGFALALYGLGLHKQIGNRLLEPWCWAHTVITSTEWDNFFALRNHEMAQPEFKKLAEIMGDAIDESVPKYLANGEWHLPYVTEDERKEFSLLDCIKFSTARCARVSYLTHDKKAPSLENDMKLHDILVGSDPKHASPSEHQLVPARTDAFFFNVRAWKSYRFYIEHNEVTKI
jgi:hypothetical protein